MPGGARRGQRPPQRGEGCGSRALRFDLRSERCAQRAHPAKQEDRRTHHAHRFRGLCDVRIMWPPSGDKYAAQLMPSAQDVRMNVLRDVACYVSAAALRMQGRAWLRETV